MSWSLHQFPLHRHHLAIKQLWKINRVHGLPAVTAPAFFTSASKGNERWWGTQYSKTVYLWDSMDDQDRQDSMDTLRTQDSWVVWKTKDKEWTQKLQQEGFVQILSLDHDTKMSKWSHKIKGWWRRGDIKATKCEKTVECWVKYQEKAPKQAQAIIKLYCWRPNKVMAKTVTSLT